MTELTKDIQYDFHMEVTYNTNTEYRQCLRDLFYMNITVTDEMREMDEETMDEMMYDDKSISHTMDVLYNKTCNDKQFQKLYDLGAATFFSVDRTIGHAVMFSYDYLYWFHRCLQCYFLRPTEWNESYEYYRRIISKLS